MPRRSRRLNPPSALDGLSDDLILRLFARAPFMTHGTLHVVCRRLKTLLKSPEFLQQRVETGLAEHGIIVAGGVANDHPVSANCWMMSGGRWRPIQPMSGPRCAACSVIIENEMWVMGGRNSNKLQVLEMTEENGLSWSCKADLPVARYGAASIVHEGKVWLMGGIVDGESSTTVLTYDADADTWEMAPPLPFPVAGGSATTMDGGIVLRCPSRAAAEHHILQYKDARWSEMEIQGEAPFTVASGFGTVLLG